MANCNNLFQSYHSNISLTKNKKDKMKSSKNALREKIRKHFKENHPKYQPKFYIQGSYKMKSGIRTKDDICDLDDGVYFFRKPDVSPTTLQTWVLNAVNGHTGTPPEHRTKCIRNIFVNDYEIDLPVYYKIDDLAFQLAVKHSDWENSDPKGLVDWFSNQKDEKGQVIKIVKYLKAWCDNCAERMPSGLAMTILCCNAKDKIVLSERDDILLTDILREMKKALTDFKCDVPVEPFDNLFNGYDSNRKNSFLNNLSKFLSDAETALREENQLIASKLWRKHLGNRFPLGENKNDNRMSMSGIIIGAQPSNPWGIS